MKLAGVDIGFSRRRRSNGIAILRDGELTLQLADVEQRNAALRELHGFDVVAIDAPIVPAGTSAGLPRVAERIFSSGVFMKRCKPGMSHIRGTGQQLREHGGIAAAQVPPGATVVEAFPNAFLGVAVPDEDYENREKLRRGGKFDWLYDRWIEHHLFERAVEHARLPADIATRCTEEQDHDLRAALVCLLTAAFAANGDAERVGTGVCGYFYLPPREFWRPWATIAPLPNE